MSELGGQAKLEGLTRAQPSPSKHSPWGLAGGWGGGWDLLESGVPSSVIAVAKPGLSLIQRPQVGKLPEGQEEETPTSAAKAQTFSRPRREGGGRASSGVGFHLKTQVGAQNMS